jgi:hypothetical protein
MIPKNKQLKYSLFLIKWTSAKHLLILAIYTSLLMGCKNDIDAPDNSVYLYGVTESWTENGKAQSKPHFYMSVYKSYQNNDVWLLNDFANYGDGIIVEVTVSSNQLTIPRQTLSNSKSVVGSGSMDDLHTMTFTYTETYNGLSNIISTVAKRR